MDALEKLGWKKQPQDEDSHTIEYNRPWGLGIDILLLFTTGIRCQHERMNSPIFYPQDLDYADLEAILEVRKELQQ